LTLVSPNPDLVYRPLAVAQPFGLGHAERYPLSELVAEAGADHLVGNLEAVEAAERRVVLGDGRRLAFDALMVTIGG
jgi:sulfide:quinone oxidoreductase